MEDSRQGDTVQRFEPKLGKAEVDKLLHPLRLLATVDVMQAVQVVHEQVLQIVRRK